MKKYAIYFLTIFCVAIIALITCEAQGPNYKVTWSNEKIFPFENVAAPNLSTDGNKLLFLRYKDALVRYG
jgi:hypothetical protein